MIRILVADDHPIVRKGIKQVLSETSDMEVTSEATNTNEVLDKLKKDKFDIVILDISMPGKSGLDLIKEIKMIKSSLPILVLTMHSEDQFGIRVLKAGASGFLSKDSASDQLVNAIRKVVSGRKYISSTLAERLADELDVKSDILPHEILSDREYEVLCLIANGKTIKEIGLELNLSPKTIETYRSRILEKMKLKNDAEIIHYAIRNKVIEC